MSPIRHSLYIILVVVIFRRLQAASGARTKRPNRFTAIANGIQSDKVTAHNYAALYDKYLQPIAGDTLRLLEGEKQSAVVRSALKKTMRKQSIVMHCSWTGLRHA